LGLLPNNGRLRSQQFAVALAGPSRLRALSLGILSGALFLGALYFSRLSGAIPGPMGPQGAQGVAGIQGPAGSPGQNAQIDPRIVQIVSALAKQTWLLEQKQALDTARANWDISEKQKLDTLKNGQPLDGGFGRRLMMIAPDVSIKEVIKARIKPRYIVGKTSKFRLESVHVRSIC